MTWADISFLSPGAHRYDIILTKSLQQFITKYKKRKTKNFFQYFHLYISSKSHRNA